jgi:hypothetical protein
MVVHEEKGMRFLLLLAAALLLGRPALAQNAPKLVPCATLSPAAVTSVPAPFDAYMHLVCYDSVGQGLSPPDGMHFVSDAGDVALSAMDDRTGPDGKPRADRRWYWYVSLTPRKIPPADDAALRRVLAKAVRPPFNQGEQIIELDAVTSVGQVKQEFIISPADPAATHGVKLLLECHELCQGDDDPWILAIVPENAH